MPPSHPDYPFLSDQPGKNYIVYADQYTGRIEVAPQQSEKAVAIYNALRNWFGIYGALKGILSNRRATI